MIYCVVPVSRACQRGFTLTEIAIVLGIIGLILSGVWTASSAVYENNRQNRFSQELMGIQQAVNLYGPSLGDTSSWAAFAVPDAIIKLGFIPPDLIDPNVGGPYELIINPWVGGPHQTLAFFVGNQTWLFPFVMPRSSCIQAYMRNCGLQSALYCGPSNIGQASLGAPPVPMTLTSAEAACPAGSFSAFWVFFRFS